VQAQRNERLAHRNPDRLQRQIDDLKALESSNGYLSARDKKVLEGLERDLARVKKAKEAVGHKEPQIKANANRGGRFESDRAPKPGRLKTILGKRSRDWEHSDSSETDESVRNIPMPEDTPPPIPPRHRRSQGVMPEERASEAPSKGEPERKLVVQTVYEGAAAIRDLRKEAVRMLPAAVKRKVEARRGAVGSRLLEEEELEELEREGYGPKDNKSTQARPETRTDTTMDGGAAPQSLEEEERRFREEMRHVRMEEVEDENL
jgi:hypothetical protein